MVDFNFSRAAGMVHAIELVGGAIGAIKCPGIHRIKAGGGHVGGIGGEGGFRQRRSARAIRRGIAGGAVPRRARAYAPTAGEGDGGIVVIQHDFVELAADRAQRHDGRAGLPEVVGVPDHLILVAHVFDHLEQLGALRIPVAGAGVVDGPAMAATDVDHSASERAGRLRAHVAKRRLRPAGGRSHRLRFYGGGQLFGGGLLSDFSFDVVNGVEHKLRVLRFAATRSARASHLVLPRRRHGFEVPAAQHSTDFQRLDGIANNRTGSIDHAHLLSNNGQGRAV